jgi:hypothetical protein
MKNRVIKGIIGGTAGTIMMTALMYMAPIMGMPKMSAPEMLAGMMGMSLSIGWMMHLMIGIIFGIIYATLFFKYMSKLKSKPYRGLVYGFIVFIVAQMAMAMAGKCILCMPDKGMLMAMGSLMGHLFYGVTLSLFNE